MAACGKTTGRVSALDLSFAIALLLIVVALFRGVSVNEFIQYDDNQNIVGNQNVTGLNSQTIAWALSDTSYAPRYMPLGWLCYAANKELFGLDPRPWHLGNVFFHAINALLLFFLLRRLIQLAGGPPPGNRPTWCAALAALWWAVNPLRVEPVAWASAQIYALATFFALVWVWAWVNSRTAQNTASVRAWSWIALASFAASLLTYPLAIFAPALLLVLDVYPLRRAPSTLGGWLSREAWPLWREKFPFFLATGAVLAITLFARLGADPRLRPTTLAEFGPLDRVMQAFYVLGHYVWKPWAPHDLAAAYPTLHAFNPLQWTFIASAALVIAITLACFCLRKKFTGLLPLWMAHIIFLVPVLGLSEYPHSATDRYAHMHNLLWAGAIAAGLAVIWRQRAARVACMTALGAVCFAFAFMSSAQLPAWRDTSAVYNRIRERFAENGGRSRFDEAVGVAYLERGRTNDAVRAFEIAVVYESLRQDRHRYSEGVISRCERRMADICARTGDLAGSARHLAASLQAEEQAAYIVSTTLRLSQTVAMIGREADALPWLEKAAIVAPNEPMIRRELGNVCAKLGRVSAAEQHYAAEQRLRSKRG